MKNLIMLIINLSFYNCLSQEIRSVRGYVWHDSISLENAIVKSSSTGNYTTTDNKGFFHLNSKISDTLSVSYLGMKDVTLIIDANTVLKSYLNIFMEESSIKLKEVIIDNYPNINAVSLGIIPKNIKKLTPNERKLKTAGDFKPTHLLSILGGQLKIDPILNSLNGRTKELKKNIAVEKKENILNYLYSNYYDYLVEDLKLSNKEEVSQFFYYLVEMDDTERNINTKNDLKIKFFLSNALFEFKKIPKI